ncbi:ketosteroid isomerase-like protein [Dyadobacter sp. BE34]|uniref:Ketosteroid isomerase-like protein n=1 Tax=Dyadobacter fermentans TaxID=94254 RepID=A0ABU1R0V4_9BACT|nr:MULTISPECIES: nuclear transport factor 2 family protein [Dyadobacter]MDR6806529.1 ketosteroid isomerase-like protein [Dyadobacter fermentans]MDR7044270.1 ketosteroid isomerase-like protein [Dyadobacter sp. BE242]MDR7198581.1 ketosteroid isomerase-like protein [Dyadobacter sp. BE34]MDR7216543.1 ketosteroid isomerase-like protein [Dyadobacter sp. BE31]MDR7263931.1 ketosteroid isomerase-like protein [Dyadobacter sp. BE32]
MSAANSILSIQSDPAAYIGIHQLILRYTDVINLRDWEALPEIFANGAVWRALSPVNLQFTGLEVIRKSIPESVAKTEYLIQFATGTIIELESDSRAMVRSHLAEFGRFKETGQALQAIGIFRDIVVKQNDLWKFQERIFELRFPTSLSE